MLAFILTGIVLYAVLGLFGVIVACKTIKYAGGGQ